MTSPLVVRNLAKTFGRHAVLCGIDLEVRAAETVALVGPNGSGKSTLLGCICGTVIPDCGDIHIGGHDLVREPILARLGLRYLPQEVEVPDGLTGHEFLAFYADVYSVPQAREQAEARTGLGEALDRLASTYSVGMRRRLGFAAALCGVVPPARPGGVLLVLDEPFAGVDDAGRQQMRTLLGQARDGGAGILVAAHQRDLEELGGFSPRLVTLGGAGGGDAALDANPDTTSIL